MGDADDRKAGPLCGVMDIARALSPGRSPAGNASDEKLKSVQPPIYPRSQRYKSAQVNWTAYTSTHDTKSRMGQRCYRMNLERPFNLHCEQSPLEYGDYMAPWPKKKYPPTEGPVDYCPPRHLGGRETIWRELMRWSVPDEEEKVGSIDMLETDAPLEFDLVPEPADDKEKVDGASLEEDPPPPPAEPEKDAEEEKEEEEDEEEYVEPAGNPLSPTNGWNALTPEDAETVKKLGERNAMGEYTFATYDPSHVIGKVGEALSFKKDGQNIVRPAPTVKLPPDQELLTVMSLESIPSTEQVDKTAEEFANETARLFRRSELSLREEADRLKEEMERKRKEAEEKERMERGKKLGRGDVDDLATSWHGNARGSQRKSKKRFSTKKITRRMSSGMSSLSKSVMKGLDSVQTGGATTYAERRALAMDTRGSEQAAEIEKARDLIDDDEEEDEGSVVGEDADKEKKPQNVSLYVMGEFDCLNDMVYDGARRLKKEDATDLDVLLQNLPCPPPDRWVRVTGWSRVAPGSVYAKMPPADFDWERYKDQLRVKTFPRADWKGKPIEGDDEATAKLAADEKGGAAAESGTDDATAKMSKLSVKSSSTSPTETSSSGSAVTASAQKTVASVPAASKSPYNKSVTAPAVPAPVKSTSLKKAKSRRFSLGKKKK